MTQNAGQPGPLHTEDAGLEGGKRNQAGERRQDLGLCGRLLVGCECVDREHQPGNSVGKLVVYWSRRRG